LDLRAARKASAERLLHAMREAARLIGSLPDRNPTVYDAGFAHGVLHSLKSPVVRACFRTGLGR